MGSGSSNWVKSWQHGCQWRSMCGPQKLHGIFKIPSKLHFNDFVLLDFSK